MPRNIAQLPPDVIITICAYLGPRDLLSFIQTCRGIHALGSTDYVWHHIKSDLPLDIEGKLLDLSGSEIKSSVIRALRLDENWNSRVSKVTRISKIHPRTPVTEMQTLGRNWLVTSSRARGSSNTINISVWRLDTITPNDKLIGSAPACVISFEPVRAFSFETALCRGKHIALISALGSSATVPNGLWTIYTLNLKGRRSIDNKPYLEKELLIEHSGLLYYSQISGSIVAAAVAQVGLASWKHQILLLNTDTNVYLKIDSPEINKFDCGRMQFKIYPPYIIIVGSIKDKIKLQVRKLPMAIFSTIPIPPDFDEHTMPLAKWDSSIVDYETVAIRNLEMSISSEPFYTPFGLKSFRIMVNHSPLSPMENGRVDIFQFPIDTSQQNLEFTGWKPLHSFPTPPNSTLEPICIGTSGSRAVWLAHQWNNDEYHLVKGSFGEDGSYLVTDLQPPELPLPFEARDCKALYLEETRGRLFVGVHSTAEVFILEFS
ncbi:F-box/WD repeat-containing protein 7 [Psilocybe cubensis]|uniref:F-box/WD repeat-containing protein 7 n=2 Tax=Psilocybe cubensis TaxID=181762 RepID=A0ACB8H258_PSICU|nr:F-box/WD repeat-containing protein 7 [Psilocybe cubensis]KAH9481722.1 F-box/WD repeat-containing protein 7 [Psilocybe cubensis]